MENLSHAGMGWRLGQLAAFRNVGPRAPLIGLIAANLPDIDVVLYALGRDFGNWQHRGATHSALGLAVMAAIGAGVTHRKLGTGSLRDHAALWGAGLLSHVLLDWPTTWGTQLLWPFSDHRFSLEWIFIIDPAFWLLLWGLPWFLARGPNATDAGRAKAAATGILSLGGWMLICAMAKDVALGNSPEPVAAWPSPGAPLRWTAVTPTVPADPQVRRYWLTLWGSEPSGSFGAPRGPTVEAVKATHTGERDFWMSASPAVLTEAPVEGGTRLQIVDLAYSSWLQPTVYTFGHTYEVSPAGEVTARNSELIVDDR